MIPISQIDPDLSIYKENTVVIWGAGKYGKEILKLLQNFDIEVTCFCDSNVELWKQEIDGVPIILPQELMKMQIEHTAQKNPGGGGILVQLAMLPQYEAQARPQVEDMGIEKVICRDEAWQMLKYYLKCDKFKAIPKFLELREIVPPYSNARQESDTFEYLLSHRENLGVLVCMPGKTGDKTVIATLEKNKVNCFQNHHIWMIHRDLFPNQRVKIITAVRDPIARDVSVQYEFASGIGIAPNEPAIFLEKNNDMQFFYDIFMNKEHRIKKLQQTAKKLGLENIPEDKNLFGMGTWFYRFEENTVDLLNHPFDKEKGYMIVKKGNFDVFFYQLEKLNDLIPELSDWVGVPFDTLENTNIAADKWIANSYKTAQKELKFSQEYFDRCYNDPYIQHCYSEADIEKFKERWRGNIDPNK